MKEKEELKNFPNTNIYSFSKERLKEFEKIGENIIENEEGFFNLIDKKKYFNFKYQYLIKI